MHKRLEPSLVYSGRLCLWPKSQHRPSQRFPRPRLTSNEHMQKKCQWLSNGYFCKYEARTKTGFAAAGSRSDFAAALRRRVHRNLVGTWQSWFPGVQVCLRGSSYANLRLRDRIWVVGGLARDLEGLSSSNFGSGIKAARGVQSLRTTG